jgi:hypothetical protein
MIPDKAVEAARKKIYIVVWSEPHVYEPSSDRNVRAFADAAEATAAAQRLTDNAKAARKKYLAWVKRRDYMYTSEQHNRVIAKCATLVGDPDYNPTGEIEYYVDTVEFIPAPPTAREGDDA